MRGRLQIVYGLLTSPEGIPVAIEVFAGNTGDPATVAAQVAKIKHRFGITKVVLAGDRGMLTAARLREDVAPVGLDWITTLRAPRSRRWSALRGPARAARPFPVPPVRARCQRDQAYRGCRRSPRAIRPPTQAQTALRRESACWSLAEIGGRGQGPAFGPGPGPGPGDFGLCALKEAPRSS